MFINSVIVIILFLKHVRMQSEFSLDNKTVKLLQGILLHVHTHLSFLMFSF